MVQWYIQTVIVVAINWRNPSCSILVITQKISEHYLVETCSYTDHAIACGLLVYHRISWNIHVAII